MSTFTIKHLRNSTLSGTEAAFTKDNVLLGRREGADVLFDAHRDPLVSGAHAEVRIVSGRPVVQDLGSSNGTFVNGTRITAATPLNQGDTVTLGAGGPEFAVVLPPTPAPTTPAAPPAPPATPEVARTIAAPRRAPAPAKPGLTQAEPAPAAQGDSSLAPVARAGGTGASPTKGPGMNTIMRIVGQATARERKRTIVIASCITLVLVTVVSIFVYNSVPRAKDGPPPGEVVLGRILPSVYVVMIRTETGGAASYSPQGTAWSLRKGELGTNAHVAEIFNELGAGETLIARPHTPSGKEPADLRIAGVTLHPGYTRHLELIREVLPFSTADSAFLDTIRACDVGLLHIEPADQDKQAPVLTLATDEEIARVSSGSRLYSAGFPSENITQQSWDRPTATGVSGIVSKKTDVFLGSGASEADNLTYTYQFETAGGGSGSPVVNEYGKVFGLLSAINNAGFMGRGRVAVGGTSYGPRVDVLRELLDKTADERQTARTERWRARLKTLYEQGITNPVPLARYLARFIADREQWTMRSSPLFADPAYTTLKPGEAAWLSDWWDVNAESHWAACVIAYDYRARITASVIDDAQLDVPLQSEVYFAHIGLTTPANAVRLRLRVQVDANPDLGPVKIAVVLVQIKE